MTPVYRTASRIAWSSKKQSAFGTPLVKTDLTRLLRLRDPLVLNESAEHWTDRGMVGSGHDWETQRGKLRQHVRFEIPVQPLPADFAGYLLALFFSREQAGLNTSGANEHTAKFVDLASRPSAYVTSLAVHEDGNDILLQDVACTSLTLRGTGSERLELGGSFLASRIVSLAGYTWPASSALRYLYNYSGNFSLNAADKKSQLRGFGLTLEAGINSDLAWRKAAAEADRAYAADWPYTPQRSLTLSFSLLAESGDLATFRTAQQVSSENALVVSCRGADIPGTNPADPDEIEITLPKAVFTGLDYNYENGLLHLDLTVEGRYDQTSGSPLTVKTTEGLIPEYFAI